VNNRLCPQIPFLEVTIAEDVVDVDNGMVNVTNPGVDAFKATLARVPAGEWISWRQGLPECDLLQIPGSKIVEEIRLHCTVLGLELQVPDTQ